MGAAEITNLFATLASHLESLNQAIPPPPREEERSLDLAISELNQSLNLDDGDDSTVKFLDTVLSSMGFKAPQVFGLVTEQLVETISTALLSSIACKVLRFQSAETLEIGSPVSRRDCAEMIKASRDVLKLFEANHVLERLSNQLLDAVVRSAASSSWCNNMFPLSSILDAKSLEQRCPSASMLLSYLPSTFSLDDHSVPLRLLLWYLDPLILNRDISEVLQETIKRPFLCPVKNFCERMDWKIIILCLVLSPAMFCETRALLHNWLLKAGLECVLEFMIDLVSVILDVISRPTWWGMSMESGLKLPFSHAYFPLKHHLFRTLSGPISLTSLVSLVHSISEEVSTKRDYSMMEMSNHGSFWALAITFPSWYYYAAVLLFSDKTSEGTIPISKIEEQSRDVASKYIAWILCPFSQTIQETLVNCLRNMPNYWTTRNFASDKQSKDSAGFRKKLKTPKFHEVDDTCHTIAIWLEKFDKIHSACWTQIGSLQQGSMFRRIPLGILIGISSELSDSAYELLLHYATTGRASVKSRNPNDYDEDEAVSGAGLVFRLTDIVEKMSESLFEDEEIGSDFVLQFKERISRFLFKCIRRLLQLKPLEDRSVLLSDLRCRFLQWKHQDREYVNPHKAFSDMMVELCERKY